MHYAHQKQPSASSQPNSSEEMNTAAFSKILSAMTTFEDSSKVHEVFIPAFRDAKAADSTSAAAAGASSTAATAAANGNYNAAQQSSNCAGSSREQENSNYCAAQREAMLAAASAAAAPAPVMLNAHRMLALSSTLAQSMQRPQWSSFDYHVLEKLYTGYASKVYKAVCKRSNEVVVLKSYQLSAICELYQHQIFREVGLHASLAHENVVQLTAAFQEGDFVILVQEYAAGGNLLDLLQRYGGRLSEHVTVQMVLEPFLRVLQYLHTRGIIHRDIKPENILFSKTMTLKLADFGLAIDLRRERAVTRAGTLDYMAPEVLNCPYKNRPEENKEKAHLHYGGTVDSWAVGVLAYELLVGCPPFYDSSRDRAKVEQRIRNAAPAFPRTMSEDAKSFITAALTKDASKRPSILQLLHHPWINTYRARRSMRQITLSSSLTASASSQKGAAAAEQSSSLAIESCSAMAAAAVLPLGGPSAAAAAAAAKPSSSLAAPQCADKQQHSSVKTCSMFANYSSSSNCSMGVSTPTKANEDATSTGSAVPLGAAAGPAGGCMLIDTFGSSGSPRKALPGSPRKVLKFVDDESASACASSSAALSSPKGLSTPPAPKPKRNLHHRQSSRDDYDTETVPMLSAKSSPLMVANMREVQLGPAYTPAAAAGVVNAAVAPSLAAHGSSSSMCSSSHLSAQTGSKQKKNWLESIKLWNDK